MVNDRDRVNLDQVVGGQRRYADHHVCRLVISEQRYPGLFDNRQAFVACVIDDVDCDLADLVRPGAGRPETNTNLLPVATTTWVYVAGVGRSSGLMHSSVID